MSLSTGMTHFVNANSAATGGIFATTCTYPLDTLNKKIIAAPAGEKSTATVIRKVLAEDGVGGFFKGLPSKLGWSYGGKFLFYGSYSIIKEQYKAITGNELNFTADLLAGYMSEWSTLPVALPFEAIATRMQSLKGYTLGQTVSEMYKDKGIWAFYNGLSAYIFLCITPAITNTLFEQIKQYVISKRTGKSTTLTSGQAFVIGAIARGISTTIMYPYLRAKTKMQSKTGDDTPETATEVIKRSIREKGFGSLYEGLWTELMRGVVSSAVTMTFKERIYSFTKASILQMAAKPALAAVPAALAAPAPTSA